MLVYIYACEGSYGGMHGMYEEDVCEVRDIEEANIIGRDMSESVIDSYEVFDDDSDIEEELEWRVYKIRDEFSIDEVRNELGNYDEENIVEMFCEPESLY